MRLLKYLFNLLRNLSFFIVLCLLLLIAYSYTYPGKIEKILLANSDSPGIFRQSRSDGAMGIQSFGMEKQSQSEKRSGASKSDQLSKVAELSSGVAMSKIKLKTTDGYVFLRPSQIVSIETGKTAHKLSTIQGRIIKIKHRAHPLTDLDRELRFTDYFFKGKQIIINCHYVEQLKGNNRVYKVIMENGIELDIPDGQEGRLLDRLESI